MRRIRRALPRRALSLLLAISALISVATSSDYGVPIEIQLWDTGRTPLAHMVDVTNEFGLKILAEHNFLNENNIAFSPYGLTGIMVALYEGVDGESSYQIQRGMQMPWNRNVMRIGFRDIHRTLKTYFVPEEGFLAGLALNNENVTFNESYKKILRFYGFDLERDQLPTLPPQSNTTTAATMADAVPTTPAMSPVPPQREETTPNPNAETLTEIDVRGPTTTMAPSSVAAIGAAEETTTNAPSTAGDTATTEPVAKDTTATTIAATTALTAAASESTSTTVTDTTTIAPMNMLTEPTTVVTESPTVKDVETLGTTVPTSNTAAESTVASTVASTNQENTESTTEQMDTQTTEQISTSPDMTTANDITTVTDATTTVLNETTLETLQRKKKSIVDFIYTSPPYVDDYLIYRSYDIPPEIPNPTFEGDGQKMFLANGLRSVQVTYMHYDTILEHAYLPHLEASALRLPLDSDRYYLLVILPNRGGEAELGRLIARMARESDLRDVHAALRPKRVRAIVPSFTVKGHVTLTTDLQKLGIRDVFEPRQRDFTPMTSQGNVYVRSIEQAVSVAIRKYRPDDQKRNRYVASRVPVHFSATYPFVYFVMDASIHVSLMAGKMVDPLNTRIL